MNEETEEHTARFFYPEEPSITKYQLRCNRKLVLKKPQSKQQNTNFEELSPLVKFQRQKIFNKLNNNRIFSAQQNRDNKQLTFGFQQKPSRQVTRVISPSKQTSKLPDIFLNERRGSCPKRETISEFGSMRSVSLNQKQGIPFLQTKQQRKIVSRIFSGKSIS